MYFDAAGTVERASILNFVSPDPIAATDGPALVAALADGTLHQRDVAVADHSVSYEMRWSRYYRSDGQVIDIDVSTQETYSPGSLLGRSEESGNRRLAEKYVCVVSTVQYRVDVGDHDGAWQTDTWADCTSIGGGGDMGNGDEGYYGGGSSGGSSSNGGTTPGLPGPTHGDLIDLSDPTPDCTQPQTVPWKIAYCFGVQPTPTQKTRLEAAINNIRGRGSACVAIADTAAARLAANQIQFYPRTSGLHGGYGRSDFGVLMELTWVDSYYSTPTSGETDAGGNSIRRNLEQTLVHETEHVMGESHTDGANGFRTPNSGLCSGFPESRLAQS